MSPTSLSGNEASWLNETSLWCVSPLSFLPNTYKLTRTHSHFPISLLLSPRLSYFFSSSGTSHLSFCVPLPDKSLLCEHARTLPTQNPAKRGHDLQFAMASFSLLFRDSGRGWMGSEKIETLTLAPPPTRTLKLFFLGAIILTAKFSGHLSVLSSLTSSRHLSFFLS